MPTELDPDLLAIVQALARYAARKDHDAELRRKGSDSAIDVEAEKERPKR